MKIKKTHHNRWVFYVLINKNIQLIKKNYLILHNNNNYKKLKSHGELTLLDSENKNKNLGKIDMKQFTEEIVNYFEHNLPNIFKKQRDLNIAYSIVELMKKLKTLKISIKNQFIF